jgi:general secretion pathway protein D
MQVFKVILVGMILAVVIIPLPGHTAAQPSSRAPQTPPPPVEMVKGNGNGKVKLNFQDTPLQTVLEYLSETAGLTVVSDTPIADARMTVISRQPISLDECVSLINSMLKEKSLTTVLNGKVLKVVTLETAKREPIPVLSGRNPDAIVACDDVVTYVIPVTYVTARALRENLQTLVPEYASLEANEDGNALIITDTLANIKRIMKIVVALDTHMATSSEIRVFRLTNADAASAASMINTMFQPNQSGSRGRSSSSSSGRGGSSGNPFQMMMDRMRGGGGPGGGPGGFGGRGGR